MNSHTLPEFRRFATSFVICTLILSCANVAASTDSNKVSQNDFVISGVALGMQFEQVLKIHPSSALVPSVPNCYKNGQSIEAPELSTRILRHKRIKSELTMRFEPAAGGRLSNIHFTRYVDQSKFNIAALRDVLVKQHGAYDRILYRRKMEPAGRIVGFEWHRSNGASLRVILRINHHNLRNKFQLTFLVRSPSQRPQPKRRTSCL